MTTSGRGVLATSPSLPSRSTTGKSRRAPPPLGLPRSIRISQVQDVADFARPDDVVVTQEVAARVVDVDGHVGLASAQGAAAGDVRDIVSEGLRVEGITESEEGGELGQGVVV